RRRSAPRRAGRGRPPAARVTAQGQTAETVVSSVDSLLSHRKSPLPGSPATGEGNSSRFARPVSSVKSRNWKVVSGQLTRKPHSLRLTGDGLRLTAAPVRGGSGWPTTA